MVRMNLHREIYPARPTTSPPTHAHWFSRAELEGIRRGVQAFSWGGESVAPSFPSYASKMGMKLRQLVGEAGQPASFRHWAYKPPPHTFKPSLSLMTRRSRCFTAGQQWRLSDAFCNVRLVTYGSSIMFRPQTRPREECWPNTLSYL